MADLSIDQIADRVVKVVLKEPHFDKASLRKVIRPVLKIWIKQQNKFKTHKAPKGVLQFTIEKKNIETDFFKRKLKESSSEEEMSKHYDELAKIIETEGYTKYTGDDVEV